MIVRVEWNSDVACLAEAQVVALGRDPVPDWLHLYRDEREPGESWAEHSRRKFAHMEATLARHAHEVAAVMTAPRPVPMHDTRIPAIERIPRPVRRRAWSL